MRRWVGWGLVAVLVGAALGLASGLLRRRPGPEVTTYLPPESSQGPTAVGPHRRVRSASAGD